MSIYVWGRNCSGQLGAPTTHSQDQAQEDVRRFPRGSDSAPLHQFVDEPVRVDDDGAAVVAIAAGEKHTVLVSEFGDVFTAGRGKEGQLGHGESRTGSRHFQKVQALAEATVVGVACGAFHSVALTSSGRMYEWGLVHAEAAAGSSESEAVERFLTMGGELGGGDRDQVTRVVADSARRWISATQLGYGEAEEGTADRRERLRTHEVMLGMLPKRVRCPRPSLVRSLLGIHVVSVAAGYGHTVAVTADGVAFASGHNDRGQLGIGNRINSGIFRRVASLRGRRVMQVACGDEHSLALVTAASGTTAAAASGTAAASGAAAAAAAAAAYDVFVWGEGRLGQLGLKRRENSRGEIPRCTLVPVPLVPLLGEWPGGGCVSVAAGANHSVAATASGEVFAWGHAGYNQMGQSVFHGGDLQTGHQFQLPRRVQGLEGVRVTSVACGSNSSLAISSDGAVYSFGWNGYGALGRGLLGMDPAPQPLPGIPAAVRAVTSGYSHAVAVTWEVGGYAARSLGRLATDREFVDARLVPPRGVPIHRCLVAARCPYLGGYIRAALGPSPGGPGGPGPGAGLPAVEVLSENAYQESLELLVHFLYTDSLPTEGAPSPPTREVLGQLGRLAQELGLARLEALCAEGMSYAERRRFCLSVQQREGTSMVEVPAGTLGTDMESLVSNPVLADVSLISKPWGKAFACHKAVLVQVDYFRALLAGGFREGSQGEVDISGLAEEGVDSPEVFEAMLRFIYAGARPRGLCPEELMQLAVCAGILGLTRLSQICERELWAYANGPENVAVLGQFGRSHGLAKLANQCAEIASDSAAGGAAAAGMYVAGRAADSDDSGAAGAGMCGVGRVAAASAGARGL